MDIQLYCGGRDEKRIKDVGPTTTEIIKQGPRTGQPYYSYKPKNGGLWSSTYTPDGEFCSDWIDWCKREEFAHYTERQCRLIKPDQDARIFVIETYDDLRELIKTYTPIEYIRDAPIFGAPLNFEAISKDYDAIQLTKKGQTNTRWSEPFNLNGWDAESTLWLRDKFQVIGPLPPENERKCKL